MIDRVYLDSSLSADRVEIGGPEAHHLGRVRRASTGREVEVFNGRGEARRAVVELVEARSTRLRLEGPLLVDRTAAVPLTLAVAFPRGERLDWLVEKCVELGVDRLVPLRTDRTVVEVGDSKLERLTRRVIEASKQCGRNRLMTIDRPVTWATLLARTDASDRRFAHPGSPRPAPPSGEEHVLIAIGPEGGFSDSEVAAALDAGWRPFRLGDTILRIETAAIAAAVGLFTLAAGDAEWKAGH